MLGHHRPSITCPRCGWTSYSADDIALGWCFRCQAVTSAPADARRFEAMKQRARQRAAGAPNYPDTPEQIAEQAAVTEALMPLQLEAQATRAPQEPCVCDTGFTCLADHELYPYQCVTCRAPLRDDPLAGTHIDPAGNTFCPPVDSGGPLRRRVPRTLHTPGVFRFEV